LRLMALTYTLIKNARHGNRRCFFNFTL